MSTFRFLSFFLILLLHLLFPSSRPRPPSLPSLPLIPCLLTPIPLFSPPHPHQISRCAFGNQLDASTAACFPHGCGDGFSPVGGYTCECNDGFELRGGDSVTCYGRSFSLFLLLLFSFFLVCPLTPSSSSSSFHLLSSLPSPPLTSCSFSFRSSPVHSQISMNALSIPPFVLKFVMVSLFPS